MDKKGMGKVPNHPVTKSHKLLDTPVGKVLKTILLTMFASPAAIASLDHVSDKLHLKEWTRWALLNVSEVIEIFWNSILPFNLTISPRASAVLTVISFLSIPILFHLFRSQLTNTDLGALKRSLTSFERNAYLWISVVSSIAILAIFNLLAPIFVDLPLGLVSFFWKFGLYIVIGLLLRIALSFVLVFANDLEYGAARTVIEFVAVVSVISLYGAFVYYFWHDMIDIIGIQMWFYLYLLLSVLVFTLLVINISLGIFTPMYIAIAMLGILIVDKFFVLPPPPV